MSDVAYFDNSIEQLDALLAEGYNLLFEAKQRLFRKGIDMQGREREFQDSWSEYREWNTKVSNMLLLTTDRQYYRVHFMGLTPSAMSFSGLTQEQSNFLLGFESAVKALVEILTMLEERRSVGIRQEIARREYDLAYRYWLRYDEIAGKLYLNGNILLATTRLDSPSDRLLQQVFASPDSLIELSGITSVQTSSALRDLNITGSLKKIFFPRTSGNKVLFRPHITNTDFIDEGHKDISLSDFVRTNEK